MSLNTDQIIMHRLNMVHELLRELYAMNMAELNMTEALQDVQCSMVIVQQRIDVALNRVEREYVKDSPKPQKPTGNLQPAKTPREEFNAFKNTVHSEVG